MKANSGQPVRRMGQWFRSTRSLVGQGACVEVKFDAERVLVRDSKNPTGPVLTFTRAQWASLLVMVRSNPA